MKRLALVGAFGLLGLLSVGPASAQMEGIGNGGLGDAKAQNQPTSVGINNGYGGRAYGYAPAGAGYVTSRTPYRGYSGYILRHGRPHRARHR